MREILQKENSHECERTEGLSGAVGHECACIFNRTDAHGLFRPRGFNSFSAHVFMVWFLCVFSLDKGAKNRDSSAEKISGRMRELWLQPGPPNRLPVSRMQQFDLSSCIRRYAPFSFAILKNMELITFFPSYFTWHYNTALRNIWGITTNFLWFFLHFFSVPILIKTFFSPWRKLSEHSVGFLPGVFFGNLIVNTLMRLIGALVRATTLILAFITFLFVLSCGVIVFLVWIFVPILLLWLASMSAFFFMNII